MVAGIPGASSLVAFDVFRRDPQTQLDRFRQQPQIQERIDEFREAFGSFTSLDELLDDRKTLEVVLSAFQLESEINFRARNKQLIEGSSSDPNALVNRLQDPRYRELNEAFAFNRRGDAAFRNQSLTNEIIDRYVVNEFEKSLGESNPGLREAAFFTRSAGGISSIFEILAQPPLRDVALGSLQLPQQVLLQDVDRQAALLESRIDIRDFQFSSTRRAEERELENLREEQERLGRVLNPGLNAQSAIEQTRARIQDLTNDLNAAQAQSQLGNGNDAKVTFTEQQFGNFILVETLLSTAETAISETNTNLDAIGSSQQVAASLNAGIPAEATQIEVIRDGQVAQLNAILAALDAADQVENPVNPGVQESFLFDAGLTIDIQNDATAGVIQYQGSDVTAFRTAVTNYRDALNGAATAADIQAVNAGPQALAVANERVNFNTVSGQINDARARFEEQAGFYRTAGVGAAVDADRVNQGITELGDAIATGDSILSTLNDLEAVTLQILDPATAPGDIAGLQAEFTALQAQLTGLRDAPPGPVNFFAGGDDDFLVSGVVGSANPQPPAVRANGIDLNNADFNGLTGAAAPDPGTAQAFLDQLRASAVRGDVERAVNGLRANQSALEFAQNTLNPLATVEAELTQLVNDLPSIRASAETQIGTPPEGELAQLIRGLQSVENSLDRLQSIQTKTNQLQTTAIDFLAAGGDFAQQAALREQFDTLQQEIDDLINSNATDTDNLLTSTGTINYGEAEQNGRTSQIDVQGINLNADLFDDILDPDGLSLTTDADAQDFLDALSSSTLIPDFARVTGNFIADRTTLENAVEDGDPFALAQVDRRINLLAPGSSDATTQLLNGRSFRVEDLSRFSQDPFDPADGLSVESSIQEASTQFRSNPVAALDLLNNALTDLTLLRIQVNGDLRSVQAEATRINERIAELEAIVEPDTDETSEFATPYDEITDFTFSFVQRYLTFTDLQSGTGGSTNPALVLLGGGGGGAAGLLGTSLGISGGGLPVGGQTGSGVNTLI